MLVVTRKPEETIIINKNIVVKVVRIERTRVVLGIAAPLDVEILRGELLESGQQP